MATYDSLQNDLRAFGCKSSDTILIHASMKSIGPVVGGADTVLDVLSDYFRDGLLVLPAHTWSYIDAHNPVFDVRESKTCVGVLTELFRHRPGVYRTLHPTHSLCALGRDAASFTAGQERFSTPCSPFSCYGKLEQRDAVVLMIGVDFSRNTLVHCIEEVAQVSRRMTDRYEKLYVRDADGRKTLVLSRRHNHANSENYVKLQPVMLQKGLLHTGKFGEAPCFYFRAQDLFAVTLDLLWRCPRLFDDDSPVPPALLAAAETPAGKEL